MDYIFLSDKFYKDFPHSLFPEIMRKDERPYILVKMRINDHEIGLPLRSGINHQHAFWTNKSDRCGVDYSKAVVIKDKSYIDTRKPFIRPKEHRALFGQEREIRDGFSRYMKEYRKALNNITVLRYEKFLSFSALKYFHALLQLDYKINYKTYVSKIYRAEFPPIKYIDQETAKAIYDLNNGRDFPLTVKQIKVNYKHVGKRLENCVNGIDMQEFKLLQDIIKGLNKSQSEDKFLRKHQNRADPQKSIKKDINDYYLDQ